MPLTPSVAMRCSVRYASACRNCSQWCSGRTARRPLSTSLARRKAQSRFSPAVASGREIRSGHCSLLWHCTGRSKERQRTSRPQRSSRTSMIATLWVGRIPCNVSSGSSAGRASTVCKASASVCVPASVACMGVMRQNWRDSREPWGYGICRTVLPSLGCRWGRRATVPPPWRSARARWCALSVSCAPCPWQRSRNSCCSGLHSRPGLLTSSARWSGQLWRPRPGSWSRLCWLQLRGYSSSLLAWVLVICLSPAARS